MPKTTSGDVVKVHVTGALEEEEVIVSTTRQEPVEFKVGEGEVVYGLEKAVIGMEPGQSKRTRIPAREAFGPNREELVMHVPLERLPEDLRPNLGDQLAVPFKDNQSLLFRVIDLTQSDVKLDANHPLAGKDLIVEIELLEILRN